jgi:hypothetical protein
MKTREKQERSWAKRGDNSTKIRRLMYGLERGLARARDLFPAGVLVVQMEDIEACVQVCIWTVYSMYYL